MWDSHWDALNQNAISIACSSSKVDAQEGEAKKLSD